MFVKKDGSVLILIVMDNGLLPPVEKAKAAKKAEVLILIVMDNGLLQGHGEVYLGFTSLNPYCNG